MSKSKPPAKPTPFPVKSTARPAAAAAPKVESHAVRETVESIVIAFVLAFLFRTFEAEAFVIPTGSMAPTLMGRHKDVVCPKCGYRYTVSASEEESEDGRHPTSDCIAGMCPMCKYVLPMRPDLPPGIPGRNSADIKNQPSYNGDRILVNKYLYAFSDPKRWDVVVFKFPGDAKVNYIKRLVGLPGESLRIYQGNVFIRPPGSDKEEDFKIERKPPEKFLAMRQLVHDTEHDPAELDSAGWPLRWHAPPGDPDQWKLEKKIVGNTVRQSYTVAATGDTPSWLRYEHLVPTYDIWQQAAAADQATNSGTNSPFAGTDRSHFRRLITDSNPYNGRIDRARVPFPGSLKVDPLKQGLHWVSDLMLEADVDVQSSTGDL
ncbi:MAG TPA: signal peptidase I, partial [Lacipirellulaceae bacterium]|nr:signal peptidase I [Lacipirellulaceae bacterium]